MRDSGEPAEAVRENNGRSQCGQQAAQRARGYSQQPPLRGPFAQLSVEHEERGTIEEQMVPGDVDEWVRDHAPPLALRHALGQKGERQRPNGFQWKL